MSLPGMLGSNGSEFMSDKSNSWSDSLFESESKSENGRQFLIKMSMGYTVLGLKIARNKSLLKVTLNKMQLN